MTWQAKLLVLSTSSSSSKSSFSWTTLLSNVALFASFENTGQSAMIWNICVYGSEGIVRKTLLVTHELRNITDTEFAKCFWLKLQVFFSCFFGCFKTIYLMRAWLINFSCFDTVVVSQQLNHVCPLMFGKSNKRYSAALKYFETVIGCECFVFCYKSGLVFVAPCIEDPRWSNNVQTKCESVSILFSISIRTDQMRCSMIHFLPYWSAHKVNKMNQLSLRKPRSAGS